MPGFASVGGETKNGLQMLVPIMKSDSQGGYTVSVEGDDGGRPAYYAFDGQFVSTNGSEALAAGATYLHCWYSSLTLTVKIPRAKYLSGLGFACFTGSRYGYPSSTSLYGRNDDLEQWVQLPLQGLTDSQAVVPDNLNQPYKQFKIIVGRSNGDLYVSQVLMIGKDKL